MFHIDATFEDIRIVASRLQDSGEYSVTFNDNATGRQATRTLTAEQLDYILRCNLAANGEPTTVTTDEIYSKLAELIISLSDDLRPIP